MVLNQTIDNKFFEGISALVKYHLVQVGDM